MPYDESKTNEMGVIHRVVRYGSGKGWKRVGEMLGKDWITVG